MKQFSFWKHFNWRILLLRIVVNGLALLFTAILPNIYFVDRRLWVWLVLAVAMGVLNAVVKPIIQFLTLRFIFATYGLVVVIINAILLGLLTLFFPDLFAVQGVFWALVGGAVFGIFATIFESLLGLTPPIVSEKSPDIRKQIEQEQRSVLEEYLEHKALKDEAAAGDRALDGSTYAKQSEATAILAVIEGGSPQATPAVGPSPVGPDAAASAQGPSPAAPVAPAPAASPDAPAAQAADAAVRAPQEA